MGRFCGAGNAFSGDYQGHCVLPLNNRYLIGGLKHEEFQLCQSYWIIFGQGTIKRLGMELSNDGIKRALLVYGQGSVFRNGSMNR